MTTLFGPDGKPISIAVGNVAHDAVDSGNPVKIGGFGTSVTPSEASGDGDRVNAWFDLRGALQAHLVNAAGDSLDVDGGALQVEPVAGSPPFPVSGTFWQATQPVSGTVTATGTKAEDAAAASGDSGLPILGVRNDGQAVRTSTDGDYGMISLDDVGRVRVAIDAAPTITVTGSVTANAGTNLNTSALALDASVGTTNTEVGIVTETAPATDTASSGLNGRLQRIAQRLTSLIALLPGALGAGGGLKVDGSGTALPVSGTVTAISGTATNLKVDASGVAVPVTDNGGSLTVDGTVTANAGTGTHIVGGDVAHDGVDAGSPVKIGGKAKAAAPADVSADADRVDAWFLRNGAQATVITAAGALVGGDAANGLDVDVTRVSGTVAVSGTFWQATQPISGTVTANAGTGPFTVGGEVAHDGVDSGNPQKVGGYAKAAAPADVSADGDRVNAWFLRNGAQATVLTAAGALIGGDATNGVDVDVTRLPALAAGTNNIGDVDVLTVPADPFGATADAVVAAGATGSISAKLRRATQGLEDLKTGIVLAAGSAAIGKLAANSGVDIGDVDVTSLPNVTLAAGTNTNEVVGDVAQDAAIAGNPVAVGYRASTAIPTAMSADGDVVYPWANRSGALVVAVAPHVGLNSDPFNLQPKTAQYTTTQTGVALVTPTGGKKLVITKVQIQVGGTTAGTMQLWFGGSADTTYTRGTDRAIFDGEFAPSATLKPGVVMDGPWIAGAADDILRVTDSAAINPLTVTVWYYEI